MRRKATTSPLVSVVTISMNDVDGIRHTIDSVAAQTHENIEYFVVDGGSGDGTVDVVMEGERLGLIDKFISEPDDGISDAFNKGLAMAGGELVLLLNSGDVLADRQVVSRVVDAYAKNGSGVYHGDMWLQKDGDKRLIKPRPQLLKRYMSLNHPGMFVSNDVYKSVGFFNTKYKIAMDYDWISRALGMKVPFYYVEHPLVLMPGGGLSDVRWFQGYREVREIRRENGMPAIFNNYLHFRSVMRTVLSRFVMAVGLGWLLRLFRHTLSRG